MSHAPPPLPPEIAEMLATEEELDAVPPELRGKIWDGVRSTIDKGPEGGSDPGTPTGGSPAPSPGGLGRMASIAGAAVLAGAIGFAIGRSSAPEPARAPVIVSVPAVASSSPPPPAVSAPAITPRDLPSAASTQVVEPAPTRAAKDAGTDVSAERTILERARSALARGDGPAAMDAVDEHQRRFASGSLIEEREALAVRALLSSGRRAQAERRAAVFRERFPRSLFTATLDADLATRADDRLVAREGEAGRRVRAIASRDGGPLIALPWTNGVSRVTRDPLTRRAGHR